MDFLLIPDKFKGSLTSKEVADAFMLGVQQTGKKMTSHFIMASDGGDGFMDAVSQYKSCISIQVIAQNPLGKLMQSYYLYNQESNSVYIELAKTSGMVLLKDEECNPLETSAYGTGLLIKDAIQKGIKNIYIGLGGSATNDGGIGIASALGYDFLDAQGTILKPVGKNLAKIATVDDTKVSTLLKSVSFYAVNDVTNPLFGESGAAYVYAAQKGATKVMIQELDAGLRNLDAVVRKQFKKQFAEIEGSGAAGGTAYGLKTFLGANYISGIDFILDLAGVHEILSKERVGMLVTGEGRIDHQTLNGKLIKGVIKLGKKYKIPVLAVCGKLDMPIEDLKNEGLKDVLEIQDSLKDLEYNMQNASQLLSAKAAEHFILQTK